MNKTLKMVEHLIPVRMMPHTPMIVSHQIYQMVIVYISQIHPLLKLLKRCIGHNLNATKSVIFERDVIP